MVKFAEMAQEMVSDDTVFKLKFLKLKYTDTVKNYNQSIIRKLYY